MAALVVAVAGGRMLGASAGTAGLMDEACSYAGGFAEAVIVDIPGASATASAGTAARILGAGTHLVAAAEEDRVHIGRCHMPAAASVDGGAGPWWRCYAVRSPGVAI